MKFLLIVMITNEKIFFQKPTFYPAMIFQNVHLVMILFHFYALNVFN